LRDGQFPGETKAIAALCFLVPVNFAKNWEDRRNRPASHFGYWQFPATERRFRGR